MPVEGSDLRPYGCFIHFFKERFHQSFLQSILKFEIAALRLRSGQACCAPRNDFMKACLLVLGIITRIRKNAAGPQKGDTHGNYS
ncbi:MAG: hypothetical protein ACYTEL_18305, partial [Planctomycetota bacterium]